MVIQVRSYQLVQKGDVFNVVWNKPSRKTIIDKKGKKTFVEEEGRTRDVTIGHQLSLDQALMKVINNELTNKNEVLSLEEYLKDYKQLVKEYIETFKKVLPDEGLLNN